MEDVVYTLSIWQIGYLRGLFESAYYPAKVQVLNVGICNGKMIVGYMKYGTFMTESIPRVPTNDMNDEPSVATDDTQRTEP